MNAIYAPTVCNRVTQPKGNFTWGELGARLLYYTKQTLTGLVKRIFDQIEQAHAMENRLREAKMRNEMSNSYYYIR